MLLFLFFSLAAVVDPTLWYSNRHIISYHTPRTNVEADSLTRVTFRLWIATPKRDYTDKLLYHQALWTKSLHNRRRCNNNSKKRRAVTRLGRTCLLEIFANPIFWLWALSHGTLSHPSGFIDLARKFVRGGGVVLPCVLYSYNRHNITRVLTKRSLQLLLIVGNETCHGVIPCLMS